MLELIIIAATLGADLLTKEWAQNVLAVTEGGSIPVIEGVFNFTYLKNTGAAFGILKDQQWLFYILTTVMVAVVAYMLLAKRDKLSVWLRISMALFVSGALGNFIDRLVFGYVRDMFDFCLINFAVFNVADACLCVAAVLFAICILFIDGKNWEAKEKKNA